MQTTHETHPETASGASIALQGRRVVVVGATSQLGRRILARAAALGACTTGVSRSAVDSTGTGGSPAWKRVDLAQAGAIAALELRPGDILISSAPLRKLAGAIARSPLPRGVQVTAVSSASTTTKASSPFAADARWSAQMRAAEASIAEAAAGDARILRPTMIYGSGRDRNIARIARALRRFHAFPMVGGGGGLRAPVHVDDLAAVVLAAAMAPAPPAPVHVPGGEVLRYCDMVERIAEAAGVRFVRVPVPVAPFALGGALLSRFGRAGWLLAVCARMTEDLTVPDDAARYGVPRRGFQPDAVAVGASHGAGQ